MGVGCNVKCLAHDRHLCTATSARTLGEYLGPTQENGHGQRVKMLAERASRKILTLVTRYQIVHGRQEEVKTKIPKKSNFWKCLALFMGNRQCGFGHPHLASGRLAGAGELHGQESTATEQRQEAGRRA